MKADKKITSALISVYHKESLDVLIRELHKLNVKLYATGGTQDFIESLGIPVIPVEEITEYPSILGGRVKTLHPRIFGGILSRRENQLDISEAEKHGIPAIDLVIVDLYPFEETVRSGAGESDIIEKIDIGGISLIRAAAKNFNDVLIVPSANEYNFLSDLLKEKNGYSSLSDRKKMAACAFNVSSHYDSAIFSYFNETEELPVFKKSILQSRTLRYGENPHQKALYFGDFNKMFDQLHGKEISYNNLLDMDAAVSILAEFTEPTVVIIKHNNACGLASSSDLNEAWLKALQADPVSAFGGVIGANCTINAALASEINKIFFEVLIAPGFDADALSILNQKKNRILLVLKENKIPATQFRTVLNGVAVQDRDNHTETKNDMKVVTAVTPTVEQYDDLEFANKIVKHLKSNTIVLARNRQLQGSGTGQTSRVDALHQAIQKARSFGFDLNGSVMASDAFFPFPDCVEIADKAGIKAVIQPGGSVKDQESVDYCNNHQLSMVITGYRHFKH
jgi:phosphoribosylaminoimidazolecarboxamide formyltransferase/IMP cyclohydrolase